MSEKITNELILEEIRRNRQELKAAIEAVEVRISMKIEETKHRVTKVEEQCADLSAKIELLEIKGKENNIVIFGLQKTPVQITLHYITSVVKKYLDIDVHASEINNFYPLGNKENCPVKLELTTYFKKALILKNTRKLKGTSISIANDMTTKQRVENRLLRKHLYIAKQNKNNNCYLKGNKLHINNQVYSPHELEQLEFWEDPQRQANSDPNTPTTLTGIQHPFHQISQKTGPFSNTPEGSPKKKKEIKESTVKEGKDARKEDKIATRSQTVKQ